MTIHLSTRVSIQSASTGTACVLVQYAIKRTSVQAVQVIIGSLNLQQLPAPKKCKKALTNSGFKVPRILLHHCKRNIRLMDILIQDLKSTGWIVAHVHGFTRKVGVNRSFIAHGVISALKANSESARKKREKLRGDQRKPPSPVR